MKQGPTAAAILIAGIGLAGPQSAPPLRVPYEAASIKPSKPNESRRSGMEFLPGGRFRTASMPLIAIIATAYNVPWQSLESLRLQMRGVPDWALAEKYDIEAAAEPGPASAGSTAQARNERIRLMLQSVLADRFALRMRRETVEMRVYALTTVARGPKLERAKIAEQDCQESAPFAGNGCHQFTGGVGRGVHGEAVSMRDLALYVSNWSDAPVIDQTGYKELFSIQTEGWATQLTDDPSRPSLADVLSPFGLRLIEKKAPVEVFAIEHIEKPSQN
jgi:uncharacterized protein (TIGR03435 family)